MASIEQSKNLYCHSYAKDGREIAVAKLVKRITDDSLLEIRDNIPLGEKYIVYRRPSVMDGVHKPTGTLWKREMYEVVEGGWLPVELLEIVDLEK